MAARYITGGSNFNHASSRVSALASNVASGVLSDPRKLEGVINVVRTAAPLCSEQTVSKINTYLPVVERISTLLGLYSFLNKAQNYAPVESLSAKSPAEKVSALLAGNSIPVGKLLAQPLIANNMEKIISSVAQNVIGSAVKNGGLEQIVASMTKQMGNSEGQEGSPDLGSLMETFMPLINNILGSDDSSPHTEDDDKNEPDTDIQSEPQVVNDEDNDGLSNDEIGEERESIAEPQVVAEISQADSYDTISSDYMYENTAPLEIRPRRRKRRY